MLNEVAELELQNKIVKRRQSLEEVEEETHEDDSPKIRRKVQNTKPAMSRWDIKKRK